MLRVVYEVEMKGIKNIQGIENMRRVLQVYMDDFAHCFGLDIAVDVREWQNVIRSSTVSVQGMQVPSNDSEAGEIPG